MVSVMDAHGGSPDAFLEPHVGRPVACLLSSMWEFPKIRGYLNLGSL